MTRLIGICGAPSTGKTTLSRMISTRLERAGTDCEVLPELARILAGQGVKIDGEMGEADYEAFLAAYEERDGNARGLTIADRTPVDHYSYLAVNPSTAEPLLTRHRAFALKAIKRYSLLFYLPIQFPLREDGFRTTDRDYQQGLDQAIKGLLAQVDVPVVELRGDKRRRAKAAVELITTLGQQSAAGG